MGGRVTQSVVGSGALKAVRVVNLFLGVSPARLLPAAILGEGPSQRALSMGQPACPGLVGLVFPAGGRVGEELAGAEGFM